MAAKALEGIRAIEFGPYVALPLTGRILASLGAEVIKVETNKGLDEMVFIPAWTQGAGQPEYQMLKKRITLDVRLPKGREILLRLVKISDVFMTNFRREVLARWGIDFPQIREANPEIIIMWQTGLGGVGPYRTYKCFGNLVQHMAGVSMMTGFPHNPAPGVVNTSYSDYHCGVFQPLAIIGALLRRRRTGKPAMMEASIFKSGAITAGPAILDYEVNHRLPPHRGNQDPYASPHGAYPCKGEDRYCAIAVFTQEEWEAFCQVLGNPSWTKDPKFATLTDRVKNADELDRLISQWTINHTAEEVMEKMQQAGVPAGIVSKGQDLFESEHLKAREFYRETRFYVADRKKLAKDWELGPPVIAWSSPVRLSETPWEFGHFSNIGEDNDYVYGKLLQMSPEEIEKLTEEGVFV
jgi:benzylsuccinate CoA-transferase BbsF subunit